MSTGMSCKNQKLALGTVQWGTDYGISNKGGKTPAREVGRILAVAADAGIGLLDTAAHYGAAEAALGSNSLTAFKVVTKTPHFASASIEPEHELALLRTFDASLANLQLDAVYGLLVHHAPDLLVPGAEILVQTLQRLKAEGHVAKVGVSVYNSDQIGSLLERFTPDLIQLPLNALDQRLLKSGDIGKLKDLGVEIHVRSVFLQGLLLMPLDALPPKFAAHKAVLAQWHEEVRRQGLTPKQAALAFVRDIDEVDHLLIGVETVGQLQECLTDYASKGSFDATRLNCNDENLLNPALWAN